MTTNGNGAGQGGMLLGDMTPPGLPSGAELAISALRVLSSWRRSALSSFAIVWIFFYELTLLSGAFGFVVCWYVFFLLLYWIVTTLTVDRPAAYDRIITTVVATCAATIIGLLIYVITGWW